MVNIKLTNKDLDYYSNEAYKSLRTNIQFLSLKTNVRYL